MLEEVRQLYAYNRWASHRILDAAARLSVEAFTKDLGNSFASVRETLVHILAAEWIWLSRWQGTSPTGLPDSWDLSTRDALRSKWAEVERDQQAFIAGLEAGDLGRVVPYRTMKGEPFSNSLGQMLRHVVNHSTYHRGQVTTMLRQLGAEAVGTDLIQFYREQGAGEEVRAGA